MLQFHCNYFVFGFQHTLLSLGMMCMHSIVSWQPNIMPCIFAWILVQIWQEQNLYY